MSAALLRKSLILCDPDLEETNKVNSKRPNAKKEYKARVTKINKEQIIKTERKISVSEARDKLKAKEKILKDNLHRIRQSAKVNKIKLNQGIAEQLIERAVRRKPVCNKKVEKSSEETVFTEEDFKKFEEEYVDY